MDAFRCDRYIRMLVFGYVYIFFYFSLFIPECEEEESCGST